MLLKEVGEKRIARERERGGASLPMPEQEVAEDEKGDYRLVLPAPARVGGLERADVADDRHGGAPR